MSSTNQVVLVGRLTKDPELRHTQGGTAVCDLSLALNSREKDGGEWTDRADYFDITVFGNQAESCGQYLAKGRQCAVSGRLRQDRWKDKDSNANRSKVVVIAHNVQFLGGEGDGGSGGGGGGGGGGDYSAPDPVPVPDDDIPF